jgi:rRNA maturation RNase YbeY
VKNTVLVRNRQRRRAVETHYLRRIISFLLLNLLQQPRFHIGVYLVGATEMARLNGAFLHHEGSTDVITFDYTDHQPSSPRPFLHGEIFVCIDEAISQARRFQATWQQELARYVIHGVLHLCGFDDRRQAERRRMKLEEDRLLAQVAGEFALGRLKPARPGRRS